jgi:hypothetical protein
MKTGLTVQPGSDKDIFQRDRVRQEELSRFDNSQNVKMNS